MWIEREISSLIKQLHSTRPALLLTGARQTGKSSLLGRLFKDITYVSLDSPLEAKQASENGLSFLNAHGTPLLIDEIQYAPELFRHIKIQIDLQRSKFGRYILTGSQQFSLMKGVSESLAGRVSILNLHTLSARELMNHYKVSPEPRQILDWIVKGGYPEIYEHTLQPNRFFDDYMATYIERDVRQLLNIRDTRAFAQFMRLLAIRSGQIFSMSRIATEVGVSTNTIKSWVSVLEVSNIIYLLKPYYKNFGKRIIKSPKLYFIDTGLLCYLMNIQTAESLRNNPLIGAIFETFILGQLLRSMHNRGQPDELYYFRDKDGHEVDFLIPEGSLLKLYECKWQDESGNIPKNIVKIVKIFGEENISQICTLTTAERNTPISDKFRVSNGIDL